MHSPPHPFTHYPPQSSHAHTHSLHSPSSVRLAFKYVLVQQRKAYETINAQSLLLQQLSAEAKRHESLLQDSQLRLDAASRDGREAVERCEVRRGPHERAPGMPIKQDSIVVNVNVPTGHTNVWAESETQFHCACFQKKKNVEA